MDNKIFIRIEKVFVYIFCAFTLLIIMLMSIDLVQFIHNPSDYAPIYQNDPSDKEWVANYILQGFLIIGTCALIFGLSLWRLIKPNKILRLIVGFLYIILIIAASIGYYRWYLTGFDHP